MFFQLNFMNNHNFSIGSSPNKWGKHYKCFAFYLSEKYKIFQKLGIDTSAAINSLHGIRIICCYPHIHAEWQVALKEVMIKEAHEQTNYHW